MGQAKLKAGKAGKLQAEKLQAKAARFHMADEAAKASSKSKQKIDEALNEALEESFPASDPISTLRTTRAD